MRGRCGTGAKRRQVRVLQLELLEIGMEMEMEMEPTGRASPANDSGAGPFGAGARAGCWCCCCKAMPWQLPSERSPGPLYGPSTRPIGPHGTSLRNALHCRLGLAFAEKLWGCPVRFLSRFFFLSLPLLRCSTFSIDHDNSLTLSSFLQHAIKPRDTGTKNQKNTVGRVLFLCLGR